MKVTKRQLRRIIKEEKQKLLKERAEPNYRVLNAIEDFKFLMMDNLNGEMSKHDRIWYEHPEHLKAIDKMFDELKKHFAEFGEMK